jgi:hypothetical protein
MGPIMCHATDKRAREHATTNTEHRSICVLSATAEDHYFNIEYSNSTKWKKIVIT